MTATTGELPASPPVEAAAGIRSGATRRYWPFLPAAVVLAGLFFVPLAIVFIYSFWQVDNNTLLVVPKWTLQNYVTFFETPTYIRTFLKTIVMAIVVTAACLAFAFPFAYFLVRYMGGRSQRIVLLAVIVPFWTSYLVRVYSWQAILGEQGALNTLLRAIGLISQPLDVFLYNDVGVSKNVT